MMGNMQHEGRGHDIAVNGITLRVRTWGELTDPARALLLVHGLTASSACWSEFGPALAREGWFAIAPDLRGRGRSDRPAHGYGLPYHAIDLLALCAAFDLPRVHYVGHSLGALIGLFLGAVHPTHLARLVLVDAGGTLPADTVEAIGAALARLGTIYPSLDAYLSAMRETMPVPWDRFWEDYFRYDALTRPDGTTLSSVPRTAIDEELRVLGTLRTEALPTAITAPTLLLRATVGLLAPERGLLLPVDEAERLQALIPDCRLVEIAGRNHYTIVQDPAFLQAITGFLADQSIDE